MDEMSAPSPQWLHRAGSDWTTERLRRKGQGSAGLNHMCVSVYAYGRVQRRVCGCLLLLQQLRCIAVSALLP